MQEKERGSSRREETKKEDRRGDHRRIAQRRKVIEAVEHDHRKNLDQRKGYQRQENRRDALDRRD